MCTENNNSVAILAQLQLLPRLLLELNREEQYTESVYSMWL